MYQIPSKCNGKRILLLVQLPQNTGHECPNEASVQTSKHPSPWSSNSPNPYWPLEAEVVEYAGGAGDRL